MVAAGLSDRSDHENTSDTRDASELHLPATTARVGKTVKQAMKIGQQYDSLTVPR